MTLWAWTAQMPSSSVFTDTEKWDALQASMRVAGSADEDHPCVPASWFDEQPGAGSDSATPELGLKHEAMDSEVMLVWAVAKQQPPVDPLADPEKWNLLQDFKSKVQALNFS